MTSVFTSLIGSGAFHQVWMTLEDLKGAEMRTYVYTLIIVSHS